MSPPHRTVEGKNGKYEIEQKLGSGCFGQVYRAKEVGTGNIVAVKFSEKEEKDSLKTEAEVLKRLGQPPLQGYAKLYDIKETEQFACLIVEMLGKSLQDCMDGLGKNNPVLDNVTAALCGEQILHRIELLHSKGIVHRDIKPENFLVGVGKKVHHIYIIDFGLSTFYYKEAAHVQQGKKEQMTGTARYTSINAMKGVTQSRRDDLEAIGHMLMYFVRGRLPWSGLDAPTDQEKFKRICDKKESFPLAELCEGYPKEFMEYLKYCRGMGFTQKPDYGKLRGLMQAVKGESNDYDFEWLRADSIDRSTLVPLQGPTVYQPDETPPPGAYASQGSMASGKNSADNRPDGGNKPLCFCCKRRARAQDTKDLEAGAASAPVKDGGNTSTIQTGGRQTLDKE
jgi:serine/threonine protein kinase